MFERFLEFIRAGALFNSEDRILLGVSGGIDSMVLMHLMVRAGFDVSAAHCNFRLRGEEADDDQAFVAGECKKLNVRLHAKAFSTREYAMERGISLQMAARELRYSWFFSLLPRAGCSLLSIAHNKNDVAETFLINLLRGTGLRGLTGIRERSGKVVRPLLFAERSDIKEYAMRYGVPFREDSSNRDTRYKRNSIRHKIIPEVEKLKPDFIKIIYSTALRLREADIIFTDAIEQGFSNLFHLENDEYRVKISSLRELEPLPAYLYGFLRRWNFTRETTEDVIAAFQGTPGKQFFSQTHRLIRDREHLIITSRQSPGLTRYYIDEDATTLDVPLKIRISKHLNHKDFSIPADRKIACLDMDMLNFPLLLRKWQSGDYFQPLGMGGLKKLSDFFIDNKFSIAEKERTWILVSGSRIAWIAGYRIDDRFRITDRTKEILMIEILE